MLIFISIAVAAFIVVAGSFLFGHDAEHDVDHGDLGHDADGEATISIFSTKVIGTLLMGFGAAGAIGKHYGMSPEGASLVGLLCGLALSGAMYLILGVFYRQQASSLVATSSAVGLSGTVTVSIGPGALGEVGITVDGLYNTYLASSHDGSTIPKGQTVRVIKTVGSQLVVQKTA
jgi:membrane-bound ClpP family serine protease